MLHFLGWPSYVGVIGKANPPPTKKKVSYWDTPYLLDRVGFSPQSYRFLIGKNAENGKNHEKSRIFTLNNIPNFFFFWKIYSPLSIK